MWPLQMTQQSHYLSRNTVRKVLFEIHLKLYIKSLRAIEKLGYLEQVASKKAIVSNCYTQKSFGCLLDTLQEKEENMLVQFLVLVENPMIDLFASKRTHNDQVHCSLIPDQKALAIDALSILWDKMIAYAYPPICHIPKISSHMKQFQCQIILIAPHIYCIPIRLPPRADLLFLPRSNIYHPDPKISFLTAWHLSTKILKINAQKKLP